MNQPRFFKLYSYKALAMTLDAFLRRCEGPGVAEITTQDIETARAASTEALARARHVAARAFNWLGPLLLLGFALLLLAMPAAASRFGLMSVPFAAAVAANLLLWTWAVFSWRRGDLKSLAQRVVALTTPVAMLSGDECARALSLMQACAGARALRDTVIARGEELREFHLTQMAKLHDDEKLANYDAERRRQCLALHGLIENSATALTAD